MSDDRWYLSPQITSYTHLANTLAQKLRRAIDACGYINEAGAVRWLGEEVMAIADRLTDGWQTICASPSEEALRAVAFKLARHLWAIRVDGVAPLAPHDRDRAAARERQIQGHIGGKELLLTLAEVLGNDADLVPIFEARHLRADASAARKIAKELFDQWTIDRTMPKPVFRRILVRRLREAAGASGP